jgi:uncharacterized protein YjcR
MAHENEFNRAAILQMRAGDPEKNIGPMTDEEIAEHFGCSPARVRFWRLRPADGYLYIPKKQREIQ